MNKITILQALRQLGELAQAEGIRLEVSIYGGAAFLLTYNFYPDDVIRPQDNRLLQSLIDENHE